MQVVPSASTFAPAPGDLASPPTSGSAYDSLSDQPQGSASTSLFATTDIAPSTTLAQMVQAPTKPLLVTPENAAGLNLSAPADNTASATGAAGAADAAATPAAVPTASTTEIAALELLLAEPANQDIIAQFGPPLRPLNTDTDVGQGILARFGADLGARLTQLQEAHNAVREQFLQALDHAQQNPGPGVAGSELIARHSSGGDAEHITEQTLYSVTHSPSANQASDLQAIEAQAFTAGGQPQHLWRLSDPAEFAKAYAAGDSPAQKAFAQLHGKEPLQFHDAVEQSGGDAGPQITPAYYSLGENQLVLGGPTVTENGNPGPWAASTWQATQLTPEQNRDLINNEYLWFDPVNGWSTDLANNIRQSTSFLDKALPMVFAGVMTFATAGAFGITAASASTSLGQTMALGAISSATMQLTTGGKIDLGELLRSALTAGVTFGVMDATGINSLLQSGDLATRSLGHLGKAGLQGVLQEATGGKFKDGLTNSLLASVAGEVGKSLEGQISELSKNESLSVQEASMLRLISRAASSAVKVAGSADPAAGFAGEFLGSVLGDGIQGAQGKGQSQSQNPSQAGNEGQAGQTGDKPSSDWVRNLGASEVDARTAQWLEAFANPATSPSSEGIVLASAPIGTVGDAGYWDDSGAYIVPARLIWPDGTTNTRASSSDGEPMPAETEVRETAPSVELLVNPETGLPDFKYTSSVVNAVNEGLDNAFSGRTMQAPGESPLTDTLQGLAYGAGKAAFELIAPVGDFLQVGNELGRSLITGEAPGEIDFISGIGQMAAQGATTADIINGGFVSLLATPDRIGDAYERGDYRSMGEEFGALGLNAALAGAGLRGSMPSVKVGVQLAAEDFAASGVGQRFGAAMEGYQYQTGALSYASEPGLKVPASWQVGTNRGVAGGELTGIRTTINLADDAATIRSLTRENESATTLANNGYKVQQNPPTLPNGKNPDYIVNGQVFDNYAPSTGNVRNAARVIEGKVATGQADNIVVNLADSSIPPSALRDQLMNYPIPGLKQVIIIDKSGTPTVIKLEGN